MRRSGKAFFAGVLLFSFNILLRAQNETVVSTAAVKVQSTQPDESPLTLNISKDARDSRVALDYSLRWDFSDLRGFRPGINTLYSLFKSASSWDITENTRLKYYGFKTNPWRVFIAKERLAPSATAGALGGGAGVPRAEYKKRLRLSLSPLVDDLERDFDANLRDALLNVSFKGASPQWSKISEADKKIFFRDILSLGVWDAPLPLMNEGKESLEYISK